MEKNGRKTENRGEVLNVRERTVSKIKVQLSEGCGNMKRTEGAGKKLLHDEIEQACLDFFNERRLKSLRCGREDIRECALRTYRKLRVSFN